jgi:hypothetical protein
LHSSASAKKRIKAREQARKGSAKADSTDATDWRRRAWQGAAGYALRALARASIATIRPTSSRPGSRSRPPKSRKRRQSAADRHTLCR